MKLTHIHRLRLQQLFVSLIFSTSAVSAIAYPIETYIGFGSGYGWTDSEFNDPAIDQNGKREIPSYTDVENPNMPWSIFAGMRVHPNYGVELSYVSFPRIEFEKTLEQRDNNTGVLERKSTRDASIHAQGITLSHVFYLPLFWNINVAAKAGLILGTIDYNDDEQLLFKQDDTNSTDLTEINTTDSSERSLGTAHLSIAANWRASKAWAVRWQVEQVQFKHDQERENFTQYLSSMSAQYHF